MSHDDSLDEKLKDQLFGELIRGHDRELNTVKVLFNLYGLLRFNAFPPDVRLRGSPLLAPLVCVRVVTRGVYKALVRETVRKNMATLARDSTQCGREISRHWREVS